MTISEKSEGPAMTPAQPPSLLKKPILGWALYDFANSAFATSILAGFFPIFFKQYFAAKIPPEESTFLLGLANSTAGLIVILLGPLLGAVLDLYGGNKRGIAFFTTIGSTATAAMFLLEMNQHLGAVLLFTLASCSYLLSFVCYDALLGHVAEKDQYHRVSGLGFSLGYLGGGALLALQIMGVAKPEWFGLSDSVAVIRWSFISVGVWWVVWSIPLLLWVREKRNAAQMRDTDTRTFRQAFCQIAGRVRSGAAQIKNTVGNIKQYKPIWMFLLAYWFYIDAVHATILMATDFGLTIGLEPKDLLLALLLAQVVGFPATLCFSRLGERVGAKSVIMGGLLTYAVVITYATTISSPIEFYFLAAIIGMAQGLVQTLSRSFFAHLVPKQHMGEFFGFYNMWGKFATIIGPFLIGSFAYLTGESRFGILAIVPLLGIGGYLLSRVTPENQLSDTAEDA